MVNVELLNRKINIIFEKQKEIIDKINQIVEKVNMVPRDIDQEEELLEKRALYMQNEIERLKHHANFPDEDI